MKVNDKRKVWPLPAWPKWEGEYVPMVPVEALKPAKMRWRDLIEEYLWIDSMTYEGYRDMEIVGIVKHEPDLKIPLGDIEVSVALFSRFRALMERLKKEEIPMGKMPQMVLGDVGGTYQAQVTLVIREWGPDSF